MPCCVVSCRVVSCRVAPNSVGCPEKLGTIPPPSEFRRHCVMGRPRNRVVLYLPSRGVGVAETLSLIPKNAPSTWVFGGGGGQRAKKLKNTLQINTKQFNDPLHSGKQNQKWPTSGQGGYMTPTASGVPNASERETKSEVDHNWAQSPHDPCRLGSPTLQSGKQNQKWTTSGSSGDITPAVWGVPTLQSGGQNQKWPMSGPSGYMHAFFSSKIGVFFLRLVVYKKNCHVV